MISIGVIASSSTLGVPNAPVLSVNSSIPGTAESQAIWFVGWTIPSDNGNSITAYRIETSDDNQTWYLQTTVSSSTTSHQLNADVGQAYYSRVLAVNSVGIGLPSNAVLIFHYE